MTRFLLLALCLGFSQMLRAVETLEPLTVTADPLPAKYDSENIGSLGTLGGGGGLGNLLRFEPNIQAGSAPGSVFSLRGVSQEGTPTVGTRSNPSVQVLVGGVPRSTNTLWSFGTPVWDVGGFEVVRGPVLFGTGPVAQGGELRLELNVPQFFHEGRLLGEAGEFDTYRTGFTENFVILPEKLAARINIASEGTDEATTNITLDDDAFAGTRRDLLRGQLRWRPAGDESSTFDFLLEAERARGNPLGLATTLPGGDLFDREVAMDTREEIPVDRGAASAWKGRTGRWPPVRGRGGVAGD